MSGAEAVTFFFFLLIFESFQLRPVSDDESASLAKRLFGVPLRPPVTVRVRSTSSAIRCRMFADRPLSIGSLSGIISFSVARLRDALYYGQNPSAVRCPPVSTRGAGAFYSERQIS